MNLSRHNRVAQSASPAFTEQTSKRPHADGSAIPGVYKPASNPVHAQPVSERTSSLAPAVTDSPAAASADGTESAAADPYAASKLANPAALFRAALGPAFTVTERGPLIDVAHQGRLAVRIAAAEVTPELVAHHQRWLSAVAL